MLVGAGVTAFVTGVQPAAEAERHRLANAGFADIRTRCRNLATVPPADGEAALAELKSLTERKALLERDAPAVERKAREKLEPRVRAWRDELREKGRGHVAAPEDLTLPEALL